MSLNRIKINFASKTAKRDEESRKYRPISLANCIAKLCETLVKDLILGHCEATKIFGAQQSAYRTNRCTTDNLVLTQHVSEAYQWLEMVGIVCLDIEKAFDVVWRVRMIDKLN